MAVMGPSRVRESIDGMKAKLTRHPVDAAPTTVEAIVTQLNGLRDLVVRRLQELPPKSTDLLLASLRIQDAQMNPSILKRVAKGAQAKSGPDAAIYAQWMAWAEDQLQTLQAVEQHVKVSA